MDALDHEPEGSDGAEQAFAALREEVAALRRGVELVYRQRQQQGAPGPDYSPTLGRMEQALQAIAGRLEAVERKPALATTPASLRVEIEAVAQGAASVVSQPFVRAVREARDTARALEALAGRVREGQEQRQWLATVGAIGVMGACCCGSCWSRCCPGCWQLAGRVATWRRPMAGRRDADTGGGPGIVGADGSALQGVPAGARD